MLEVLFSDSAAGSLKCGMGHGSQIGGCLGIIATDENGRLLAPEETARLQREAEEKVRRDWAEAAPVEGTPQDILSFPLSLGMGPIDEDGIGPLRENALEQLLDVFPQGRQTATALVTSARRHLDLLLARAPKEPVRFWVDRTPDAACGLCWALDQLRPLGWERLDLRVVDLSHLASDKEGPFGGRCAGGIEPHAWGELALQAQPLPARRAEALAQQWHRLRQEDAPLRALLNGLLVSAAVDLYDPYLRAELEELDDTFREAELIGRTLGRFPLCFGDAWLALRVEQWIADGELQAVTTPPRDAPAYHRMLRKMVR